MEMKLSGNGTNIRPTIEQRIGIEDLAQAHGWDRLNISDLGIVLWALFHYYVGRL